MLKFKRIREKGKTSLSRYFDEFKEGDNVSLTLDAAYLKEGSFPDKFNGKIGKITGKSGRCYIIEFNDQNKPKKIAISPIHLKKLK